MSIQKLTLHFKGWFFKLNVLEVTPLFPQSSHFHYVQLRTRPSGTALNNLLGICFLLSKIILFATIIFIDLIHIQKKTELRPVLADGKKMLHCARCRLHTPTNIHIKNNNIFTFILNIML